MATDARQPEMGLDFDKVWATIQETAQRIRESGEETHRKFQETAQRIRESNEETNRKFQETDQRIRESSQRIRESNEETDRKFQETDRRIRESSEKTDRLIEKLTKETNKQIGDLGGRFGELAEHLIAPGILKKFNTLGYGFTKCSPNVMIEDDSLNLALEIDLFLENGDCAVAVEVKANLKTGHVENHMNRMEKLRRYADARGGDKKSRCLFSNTGL
jgi:exonuclease VII large subunit